MSFKDTIAADVKRVMDTNVFAESILYDGAPISAIPEVGEANQAGNTFTRNGSAGIACFWITAMDVAWPKPGSKIEFAGRKYTVSRLVSTAGGLHKVEATYKESVY